MARSQSVTHYPEEYRTIIRRAVLGEQAMFLRTDDRMQAVKMRGHLYAFVGALKKAKVVLAALPRALTAEEKDIAECAKLAERLLIQLVDMPDGRTGLSLGNRKDSWQAKLAAASLAAVAPPHGHLGHSDLVATGQPPQPATDPFSADNPEMQRLLAISAENDRAAEAKALAESKYGPSPERAQPLRWPGDENHEPPKDDLGPAI